MRKHRRPELYSDAVTEFDDALLGPESILACFVGDECAMATMIWGDQVNCGMSVGTGGEDGRIGHEGIVFRSDDQGRNTQVLQDSLCRRSFVILVGVAVTKVRGGNEIIELANGADGR